ncbi:ATP-binding protein [Amycolatopsis sp. NPDC049691]|uniref:ATP-binding protein n=1 Tax=Amycolatopsis sp. NPDC049691 TaxID=3155155 RepID=UPI00341B4DE4
MAADGPPALIADIDGLIIRELSPVVVFPRVARRIAHWPGIPLALVTRQEIHLQAFRRRGVDRFVAVHGDAEVAESRQEVLARRGAHRKFPRTEDATKLAGAFLRDRTTDWGVPELFYDAVLIVNELLGNALQHTTSSPELHLDLRQDLLTIAVADENARPAVLLERTHLRAPGIGLSIVADTAATWGSSRRWSGGKVVWATLAVSPDRS